tara:strand:+ start:641 stop:1210 length:570 start_codon:yes stop_codon:yes gene_type:complete
MERGRDEQFKIVCAKEGICLEKSKSIKHSFRLSFISPSSPSLVCEGGIDCFYRRLGQLNHDIIKDVVCRRLAEGRCEVTLHFEAFAQEFGMAPKTMTLHLEDYTSPENITYTGRSPVVPDENDDVSVACNDSTLRVISSQTGGACLEYRFHLDLREELPLFMDNVAGLLMKKVFLRLKQYLEKSIHDVC